MQMPMTEPTYPAVIDHGLGAFMGHAGKSRQRRAVSRPDHTPAV
jgi:hypothetical protein